MNRTDNTWCANPKVMIAADLIKMGAVVAYPTEAVWGLGCNPWDGNAVMRLLHLKGRPAAKGVILVAASTHQFEFLLDDLTLAQRQRLAQTWPGPNTWILPHRHRVPPWIHGDHPGVALRVSTHPLVRALCQRYGGPLVSTSANPQGKPAATAGWQVRRYFKRCADLAYITPGVTSGRATPSTIRDIDSLAVIRP